MPTSTETTKSQAPNEDGKSKGAPEAAVSEEKGDTVDDYGYEKESSGKKEEKKSEEGSKSAAGYDEPKDEKKVDPPKEEEIKDPVTGYDKAPESPKADDKKPVEEKKTEDAGSKDEFTIKDVGKLLPEEVKELTDFVNKYKISKEAAQALVDAKKAEVLKIETGLESRKKETEAAQIKQRRDYYEELKNDPVFGGEKFQFNIKRAEKVLEEFMPEMKKKLTEGKGMLPPYVMRDLAKLASHLFSTEKLNQGDPVVAKKDDKEENDPLDFYS